MIKKKKEEEEEEEGKKKWKKWVSCYIIMPVALFHE